MQNVTFISLGGACRTATQIKKNFSDSKSFPFDWTVTPFTSLKRIFDCKFNPVEVLSNENISIKSNGGIKCSYSELDFHHDLNPKKCVKWFNSAIVESTHTMPPEFYESEELTQARERFRYTFKRLEDLQYNQGTVVFIRWLGHGRDNSPHQRNFPHAGIPDGYQDGENFFKVFKLLKARYPNVNVRLYEVFSRYTKNIDENRIVDYHTYGDMGGIYLIKESIPKSFSGDDESWTSFFNHIKQNLLQENLPDNSTKVSRLNFFNRLKF